MARRARGERRGARGGSEERALGREGATEPGHGSSLETCRVVVVVVRDFHLFSIFHIRIIALWLFPDEESTCKGSVRTSGWLEVVGFHFSRTRVRVQVLHRVDVAKLRARKWNMRCASEGSTSSDALELLL